MTAEPYDRGRYLVHAHGEVFTVDTLANRGNGSCDCWAFIRKNGLRDQIEAAGRNFKPGPTTKCPHIVAADAHLLGLFKERLRELYPDNEPTT